MYGEIGIIKAEGKKSRFSKVIKPSSVNNFLGVNFHGQRDSFSVASPLGRDSETVNFYKKFMKSNLRRNSQTIMNDFQKQKMRELELERNYQKQIDYRKNKVNRERSEVKEKIVSYFNRGIEGSKKYDFVFERIREYLKVKGKDLKGIWKHVPSHVELKLEKNLKKPTYRHNDFMK